MRNTRVVALMTILASAPALARGDSDAPASAAAPAQGGLLRSGIEAVNEEDARDLVRFERWRKRMDVAYSRGGRGRRLMLWGGSVALASVIGGGALAMSRGHRCSGLHLSATWPQPRPHCEGAGIAPTLISSIGGAVGVGMAGIGAMQQHDAMEDLDALYAEGHHKGYLSLGSIPGGGIVGAYTLRF